MHGCWVMSSVVLMFCWNLSLSGSHSLTFKWCFYLTATSHDTFATAFLSACFFSKALWIANGSMELHKELLKFYSTNCCPLPSDPWWICSSSAWIAVVENSLNAHVPANVLATSHMHVVLSSHLHYSANNFSLVFPRRSYGQYIGS